ncbi:MAG: rod shape-determining protein MreD [Vicinamibacterales bacterium]
MRVAAALLAILVALALQTTLTGWEFNGIAAVDLVLVLPLYLALTAGAAAGLMAASVAGLLQDSLSSGILGIGALAKTIVAYLAGIAGTQFILTGALQRFLTFFLATIAHAVIFMGLYVVLDLRQFPSPESTVLTQAIGNGVVGVVGFEIVDWLPGFLARRRASRPLRR